MAQTNMDSKNKPNATAPVMEFTLPENEVDAMGEVGDHGRIYIEVEIISRGDGVVGFRKLGKSGVEGEFRPESTKDMRKRILDQQEDKAEGETGD